MELTLDFPCPGPAGQIRKTCEARLSIRLTPGTDPDNTNARCASCGTVVGMAARLDGMRLGVSLVRLA